MMTRSRLRLIALVVVPLLALAPLSPASAAAVDGQQGSSEVVQAWEQISIRTIYGNPLQPATTPIAVGVPYLGYTSLAMYQAALAADRQHASIAAATAQAAHDVLMEYFPTSTTDLNHDLELSLAAVAEGPAKQRGIAAGVRAASKLIHSRADDQPDPSIVYAKPAAPGVWQPAAGGSMLAPWLGFIDPLVIHRPLRIAGVDGPDPLQSATYARQYNEVRKLGAASGSTRTKEQTETAVFFNSNSAIMVSEGLLRYLEDRPIGLLDTARLFAMMHSSMTDALIICWRLKYEVGFWRPFQAIHGAGSDGNPATEPDVTWASLLPNPPYGDYVSGHGCVTSPAVEVIRRTLGEKTALTLHSYSSMADRTYSNLRSIEWDAFHSRIWGGLHFRTAMEDAYAIGHATADRVVARFGH